MTMRRGTHKAHGMLKALVLLSLAGAVSLGIAAGAADAVSKRTNKARYVQQHRPNVVRQDERTPPHEFDETEHYERRHQRIPFGSPAWWKQREFEFSLP